MTATHTPRLRALVDAHTAAQAVAHSAALGLLDLGTLPK